MPYRLILLLFLLTTVLPAPPIAPTETELPPDLPSVLTPGDWQQIVGEYEKHRHGVVQDGTGTYKARNPRNEWLARWDGRGVSVQPDDGEWTWGLQLQSYGDQGQETEITNKPKITVDANKLTYHWNEAISEWYVNNNDGLKHGFTLHRLPMSREQGPTQRGNTPLNSRRAHNHEHGRQAPPYLPTRLTLGVTGGLASRPTVSDEAFYFRPTEVRPTLRYSGLRVWDAEGKRLPARMSATAGRLLLSLDPSDATYPITVDPIIQQAYLKASNSFPLMVFGSAVAISGDTVVVGANGEASGSTGVNSDQSDTGTREAGAAYVFVRENGRWTQQAYIKASNTEQGDSFGVPLALDGDTLAIAAVGEDSGAAGPDADQLDNSAAGSGAVYIFVREAGVWSQQAYLKASNPDSGDAFGVALALGDDTLVVGATGESSSASGVNGNESDNSFGGAGAVYVFVRHNGSWTQQAYIKASNPDPGDRFGSSVDMDGDTIVVGAPEEGSSSATSNNNAALGSGAANIFERTSGTWQQTAFLKAPQPEMGDGFGAAVTIAGTRLAVGAPAEDSASPGVNGDQTNNRLSAAGAVYTFLNQGGAWLFDAYLKAGVPGRSDLFGAALDLDGDRLLVGAPEQDGSATGVNGNEGLRFRPGSGAAFLFENTSGEWGQTTYLKASNTDAGDHFGRVLALTEESLIVGARFEASPSSGINGSQGNRYDLVGAAYVFEEFPDLRDQNVYRLTTLTEERALALDAANGLLSAQAGALGRPSWFRLNKDGDSTYQLRSQLDRLLLAESSTDRLISTREDLTDDTTRFQLELQPDGSYKLTNLASGRFLQHDPIDNFISTRTQPDGDTALFRLERVFFNDIAPGGLFTDAAGRALAYGITDGCQAEPLKYCPNDPTTRGQMAVFIIRALFGGDDFDFPAEPFFDDVPATHTFFRWIQKLRELGITSGCSATNYCPGSPVTRGQMAVFIIRARYGTQTVFPFSPTVFFSDVPATHPFFAWIQRLLLDGVTSGCATDPFRYCPDNIVTRGQMAVFIIRGLFNELFTVTTPRITAVTPSELTPATTTTVTFTVADLDLTAASPTLLLGANLTAGTVVVVDASTATVDITVEPGAPTGPRALAIILGTTAAAHPRAIQIP